MVVVLAIISVITAVIINGQSTYNASLVLTDTAYTVAYSVRQAQSLGLSSRATAGSGNAGYGIRFYHPQNYSIFVDTANAKQAPSNALCPLGMAGTPEGKPGNCRYDDADTAFRTYSLSRGFTISDYCGKNGSASLDCSPASLTITFMRPDTRAVIIAESATGAATVFTCAEIHVTAPGNGVTRVVRVSQLGEISVGQTCP
jgi:hypothetical protein